MWQYSWAGAISGIDTDVSCNYYFGRLPSAADPNACEEHLWTYTYAKNEYHTFSCDKCGKVVTGDAVAAEGATDSVKFSMTSITPSLSDDISLTYKIRLPEGFTSLYAKFTFNGVDYYVDAVYDETSDRYLLPFSGIIPQTIGDNVDATFYATFQDEQVAIYKAEYSMLTYCKTKLTGDEKLVALISDLLTYGAACQTFQGYKTDALITDGLTLKPSTFPGLDDSFKTMKLVGTSIAEVKCTAVTLSLDNKMTVRYALNVSDLDAYTFKVTIDGETYTYTGDDLEYRSEGKYYLYFDELKATSFNSLITLEIYEGETRVSSYVEYSVNSYIYSNQNNSNASLQALVRAIYNYGASAANYV